MTVELWLAYLWGYAVCWAFNWKQRQPPEVTLKVIPSRLDDFPTANRWTDIVQPICHKCIVHAKFNGGMMWTPTGALAVAELLKVMADKLDTRIDNAEARIKDLTTP